MEKNIILEKLLKVLPLLHKEHSCFSPLYSLLYTVVKCEVEKIFNRTSNEKNILEPFGLICMPYFSMGAVSSLNLFELDELILFSFYWANRNRYKRVLDIGANIGLHSVILSRCGFEVQLFEPDPIHFKKLEEILHLNDITNVKKHCAAVSSHSGQAEFVRVLGNTTSSHLAGSKQPYGDLEKFSVPLIDIREVMRSVDFIKMDVEGHEKDIILATDRKHWEKTDMMLEVGSQENAKVIFTHLKSLNLSLFSQKTGWGKVEKLEDMPTFYKEGSLFISAKKEMVWSCE
jgi:FkbM family methyltransferase